ncbi:MAG: AAA family ATPase [Oscillospiraceae bacterium]|nr:AAA family ATPase [Oscillospiraceae bacterium]
MLSRPYISAAALTRPIEMDRYLLNIPAIQSLAQGRPLALTKPVTFFVGENGAGKSTLLEAIAVAYGFNPEGGTKNFHFSTSASHSSLWRSLTLTKRGFPEDGFFLRAESFYNVATNIDQMDEGPSFGGQVIDSYGGISLHRQSHGESFLALVQNRFGGHGVYLLDEPEAALSPTRLLSLLVLIDDLVKNDSQLIIATHSPILMAYPGADILQFSENGIQAVPYKETEHYQVTRRFLEDPGRMLRYLLDEG